MIESPFVRTGAVVRCGGCGFKYRVKSSQVERVLTTGPRTLDETDTVLRSDSVDIDPDEVAPVSIDDEGNVVGLSGLSELMRRSDAQGAKNKVLAQMEAPAPPASKPRSKDKPREGVVRLDDEPVTDSSAAQRRARLLARRRRKRTHAVVLAALACLVVVGGVVVATVVMRQRGGDTQRQGQTARGGDKAGGLQDKTPPNENPAPGGQGDQPSQGPGTTAPAGDLFAGLAPPTPNPDPKFVPPWPVPDPDAVPTDVPTVVTPAKRLAHEGWYIMSPPRGSADAAGEADVGVDDLTPGEDKQGTTLLTGAVNNQTERVLLAGELHVMLLDSSGRVFAETYMPLAMIGPGAAQQVVLPIPTRHWKQARGVRTAVTVDAWSKSLSPLPGVAVQPVGQGGDATLRISARNRTGSALRGVLILIEATDARGAFIDRFVVENEKLYVSGGQWLDMVIATPLPDSRGKATWSVIVQPR